MKRLVLCLVMGAGILALMATPVFAFHDEGVAYCAGCHTMHNSQDGQLIDPAHPNGNAYLLKYGTPSETCLSCHATSHGAVWVPDPLVPGNRPGGNFAFLGEDNLNDGHSGHLPANFIPGSYGGHNCIAPSYPGGVADPVLTSAPGGLGTPYPASVLSCTSCHDPHGNTNFRLLYGAGDHVQQGNFTFANPAPDAEALSYNDDEANNLHTAYHDGMSAWCGNCHGDYHNNSTKLIHPSGVTLGGDIASTYNLYNGTDDPTGGNSATAYLAMVPFEDPANTTTSTTGPTASSKVSCITCHRAHGSSAPNIGRWDFAVTLLDDDGVESGSYAIPNPYGDPEQRSLCNKCHNKD